MVKNISGKNFGEFGELQAIYQSFFHQLIFTAFNRIAYGFRLPMAKHMAFCLW